ncbi:MAG: hypothetical protein E7031_08960 [Akkermansiaceae bacterium]|nr:hypothetical protein [Akkermansiaceae bacterium]
METTLDNQNKLLKQEGRWFILYFSLFMLVFGYTIFRLGLDTDDIHDFNGQEGGLYIAAGRWSVVMWRFIFGDGACLWAAGVTAGLIISALIIFQCHLLKFTGSIQRLIYGGFYISCCQFNHMLQFSFLCDVMAASFLAVTGAVWLMQQEGRKAKLLSILLLTLALGTYQANCFYFSTLFLAVELRKIQLNGTLDGFKQRFIKMLSIGFCATAAWFVIYKLAVHLPFITEEQISFATGYQSSINYWGSFIYGSFQDKFDILWNTFSLSFFIKWSCWASLIAVIALGKDFAKQLGKQKAKLAIILLVLLCLSPYGLNFALLRQHEEWSTIAEPVMLAAVWAMFAAESRNISPTIQRYLLLFLAFSLFKGMYSNAAWARDERHDHEILIAEIQEMRSAANAASIQAGQQHSHVVLLGNPWFRQDVDYNAADSTLPWAYVMKYYLRYLKLTNMHIGTPEDHDKHMRLFNAMPTWPAPGSVQAVGNEVIIKIGPITQD